MLGFRTRIAEIYPHPTNVRCGPFCDIASVMCRRVKWGLSNVESEVEPDGVSKEDIAGWRAHQVMVFLDNLINAGPGKMAADRLARMDEL
eukprot:5421119-Amphidinium_carterae.3